MAANKTSIAKTADKIYIATDYEDFVIHVNRKTPRDINVEVYKSPAGEMDAPVTVPFSAIEAKALRDSFCIGGSCGIGRGLITAVEATQLGKRLASVLLPPAVFFFLSKSLTQVLQKEHAGLRIRLVMDESLVDLPWEYLYRPDRLENTGVSGFLLLDPSISLVREAANPRLQLQTISGRQRLAFIGTLWEGNIDGWEVGKEYDLLKAALKPVSKYIAADFSTAHSKTFKKDLQQGAAIFHYAGHCDFEKDGTAFMVKKFPNTQKIADAEKIFAHELAPILGKSKTRLAVLSACNSGFWQVVKPFLDAGLPAIIGVNGGVASISTIEFCTKLYESLAVGLTLDEAISRARLHVLEWGRQYKLFDWGLFMVYMPSPQSVIFPRIANTAILTTQKKVRQENNIAISSSLQLVKELDGLNFGEIMSELIKHRVLILGRFTGRRLKILKAIQEHLAKHKNRYIPELFTFSRPDERDLIEAITGFAALSRFIIADLSEPKSLPAELEAIVPHFLSIPIVPVINKSGKPYATFTSIQRRENVIELIRYADLKNLLNMIDEKIVGIAENKLAELKPQ